MVMLVNLNTCILALVALSFLFEGSDIGPATGSVGFFVNAAPMSHHKSSGGLVRSRHPMSGNRSPKKDGGKKFRRQDSGTDGLVDSETLGRLIKEYKLLEAAVPAAPEGSDLQKVLLAEIDQKKDLIFQKFGTIVPDNKSTGGSPTATTVSSADGSLVTIYSNPDSAGVIIASNGQNQTVSPGPAGQFPDPGPTSQAGASDQQRSPTSTVSPTSTSIFKVSSTTSRSGTSTGVSASSAQASASSTKTNVAVAARPLDILPTSGLIKSFFTVAVAIALGAWTVL